MNPKAPRPAMAIFDDTRKVLASTALISQTIKATISPNDQLIISRPDTLLIAIREGMGYLYLLHPTTDGSTIIRLIMDTAHNVREAFRGKSPKDALIFLTTTRNLPTYEEQTPIALANMHLDKLKHAVENPSPIEEKTVAPSFEEPPLPELLALSSSADPTISAIFARKPLPGAGASTHFPEGMPQNPHRLVRWTRWFTPAAGIGMAHNWPKLGKPHWMWPTLIAAIVIPVAMIAIPLILLKLSPRPLPSIIFVVVLLWGVNWAFICGLWYLQHGAYRK